MAKVKVESKTEKKPEEKQETKPAATPKEASLSVTLPADLLRTIVSAVATVAEEAAFTAEPEGLNFKSMDPSHVVLVDLDLPKEVFDKYRCTQPGKITIKVEDLKKLVRRADSKDTVEISTVEEEEINVKMTDGYDREYTIHRLESLLGETPLPKLSYSTEITIVKQGFVKTLDDIAVVGDHVTIAASKDKVVFSGKSDFGSGSATLAKGHQDLLQLKVKEDSRSTYGIDYLLNITKALVADKVLIEYSSKTPVRLTFKLSEKGGQVQFYAAPRIEV